MRLTDSRFLAVLVQSGPTCIDIQCGEYHNMPTMSDGQTVRPFDKKGTHCIRIKQNYHLRDCTVVEQLLSFDTSLYLLELKTLTNIAATERYEKEIWL